MQYLGGKSRIARYIAEIINNTLNGGGAFNEIPGRQEPHSNTFGADPQRYGGGSLLHRAFCKEYNTGLGCPGKRGKQI